MNPVPRLLCVLFADVVGSTRLYEKLGDAKAKRVLGRYLDCVKRAAAVYRGRLVKIIGDEALVVFDSTEEGFMAACQMQQKIENLPLVSGCKLAIRIGFYSGAAIGQQGDAFDDIVNTAARLVAQAKPGQVITDGDTVKLLPLPGFVLMRQLDSVKGKGDALQLWEALWRGGEDLTRVPDHFVPTVPMEHRLRLKHGNKELFVSETRPVIALGRDTGCDLVIVDPRASRSHARIEQRRDKFVLTDQSTNGTYIATEQHGSHAVKREEAVLRGKGRLSFGQPWKEGVPDFVDYVVIG